MFSAFIRNIGTPARHTEHNRQSVINTTLPRHHRRHHHHHLSNRLSNPHGPMARVDTPTLQPVQISAFTTTTPKMHSTALVLCVSHPVHHTTWLCCYICPEPWLQQPKGLSLCQRFGPKNVPNPPPPGLKDSAWPPPPLAPLKPSDRSNQSNRAQAALLAFSKRRGPINSQNTNQSINQSITTTTKSIDRHILTTRRVTRILQLLARPRPPPRPPSPPAWLQQHCLFQPYLPHMFSLLGCSPAPISVTEPLQKKIRKYLFNMRQGEKKKAKHQAKHTNGAL